MAGDLDPSSGGTNSAGDLEEVVGFSGRAEPGGTLINADLHLGCAALGVDDLCAEPVLGYTRLHVDFQVAADIWAGYVVPGYVDDTHGGCGELIEGIGEEVKVVVSTAGAFVNDLREFISRSFIDREIPTHHCSDGLAAVSDCGTTTAVAGGVPVRGRKSSSVKARGQGVGGERACSTCNVTTVESGLARQRATGKRARVQGHGSGSGSQSRGGKRRDGGDDRKKFELHFDRPAVFQRVTEVSTRKKGG